MIRPLLFSLVAIYISVVPVQQVQASSQPLLVIAERQINLSPRGVSSSDCLLVRADGRVYLKRRLQSYPGAPLKIGAYQAVLSPAQFKQLRAILDDKAIRALVTFTEPEIPATVSMRHDVKVEIRRKMGMQRVGYSDWKGHPPSSSREDAPPGTRQAQMQAARALKPLLDWLHNVETMKLTPSTGDHTQCSQ
jgi:hypothetical protein